MTLDVGDCRKVTLWVKNVIRAVRMQTTKCYPERPIQLLYSMELHSGADPGGLDEVASHPPFQMKKK